jgi:hypothetical protein
MTTDQKIIEEASIVNDEEPMETIHVDSEKGEQPRPSWFVHQLMKYLLPSIKD